MPRSRPLSAARVLAGTGSSFDRADAGDLDDRGGRLDHPHATLSYQWRASTKASDHVAMRLDLLDSRLSLEREHPSTRCGEGKAPRGQPVEGSDRACGDNIGGLEPRLAALRHALLSPDSNHGGPVQPESRHRLQQECGTSCQRLDQYDRKVRSCHCQYDTGQSGTRSNVRHPRVLRNQLRDSGTVQ